jgi:hypothetical protein
LNWVLGSGASSLLFLLLLLYLILLSVEDINERAARGEGGSRCGTSRMSKVEGAGFLAARKIRPEGREQQRNDQVVAEGHDIEALASGIF